MEQPSAARKPAKASAARHVTCPFCALHCDDLTVEGVGARLKVTSTDCPKAAAGFATEPVRVAPTVAGRPATLDAAITAAAEILRGARAPLYAGLACDVAGMRAVIALAERTGGIVDHLHGDGLMRNILALQDSGWIMTTLAEVRNRADLILFVGTDANAYPRFYERCVWNDRSLFGMDCGKRELVFVGAALDTRAGIAPNGRRPTHIRCEQRRLGEVIGALRALAAGRRLEANSVAGVERRVLGQLVERLRAARYGVVVWAPAELAYPHAELTIESVCALVRTLNETTRFGGLALGGDDGGMTAINVCAWQTGYPIRVGFGPGYPVYEPALHATARLLAEGAVDRMLWIAALSPKHRPPATRVPLVVLGHPRLRLPRAPAVFIPVATPGLDHAGQVFRCDTVVALPLAKLRASPLPDAATVVQAIDRRLG